VVDTLEDYIRRHEVDLSKDHLKTVRQAGHGQLVAAVVKIFFSRRAVDNKRYAVWLVGPTSAGKSKFIARLQEILVCQKADFTKGHVVVQDKQHAKARVRTQVVVFPEFNINDALDRGTLPNVLQLFEGEGAPLKPNLYQAYATSEADTFKNTYFLCASNRLPEWCQQSKHPKQYKEMWEPLMSRVEMVYLAESFLFTAEFPYTA